MGQAELIGHGPLTAPDDLDPFPVGLEESSPSGVYRDEDLIEGLIQVSPARHRPENFFLRIGDQDVETVDGEKGVRLLQDGGKPLFQRHGLLHPETQAGEGLEEVIPYVYMHWV
jgi:hypothetical protein